MKINTVIEADRAVYAKLDGWDKQLVNDIKQRIVELTGKLESLVRANAPVGADNHGGRLRGSIHSSIRESEDQIAGIVTGSVPYLPVVEFGLHKELDVRAHERRLAHAFSRDIDPITVFVDPYKRLANFEETRFMQRALETMGEEIAEELRTIIDAHSGEIEE